MGGEQTLLVDMDPQCNATSGLGLNPVSRHPLVERGSLVDATHQSRVSNLHVLPGSRSFHDVDMLANSVQAQSEQVAQHLRTGIASFDYVVVDCPPSLGALTKTALAASSEILMPIQCEYFAICLLYTSPSPRDATLARMPSSA